MAALLSVARSVALMQIVAGLSRVRITRTAIHIFPYVFSAFVMPSSVFLRAV
jgi:hypothetical protein